MVTQNAISLAIFEHVVWDVGFGAVKEARND
jgi:hypothetical protein